MSEPGAATTARRLPAPPPNVLRLLHGYAIVFAVLALFLVLTFASEAFLTKTNLLNILSQNAPLGIIACGATLVIVGGGFDLSVGAIFAVCGVIAAWTANHVSPEVGIAVGMAAGLLFGAFNGFLVAGLGINAFIATIASALVFAGVAELITGGELILVEAHSFSRLGLGEVASVRYSVLIFAGLLAAFWFLLARTSLGAAIYAVGGNSEAARLSGVRVAAIRVATFMLSGLTAAVAGVLAASRVSTGQSDAGAGLELQAIAAVVIGGTSIMGGEGAVWRTALGVMLLALIVNGFNILNVDPVWQGITQGAIILGAVALDVRARRRAR
ncbi:MAG: ABC transporter permease [Solirubrobacterales bacterium]